MRVSTCRLYTALEPQSGASTGLLAHGEPIEHHQIGPRTDYHRPVLHHSTTVAPIPRVHAKGKSPCPGDLTLRRPPSMVLGSLHLGLIRRRRTQEGCGTHAVAGVRDRPGCAYGLAGQRRARGCSRSALAAWHRAPTEMTLWAAGACEWRPTTWGGVDGRECRKSIRHIIHLYYTVRA